MMTVVINGTTGIDTGTGSLIAADATTPTYLDLFEDTDNGSNYVRLIAPTSIASNRTLTLPDGTGTFVVNGVNGTLVSGTAKVAVTDFTTSADFTGIPSWVERITVMFNAVSLTGSDSILVQIGSGSLSTSGYTSGSSSGASGVGTATSTSGFIVRTTASGDTLYGSMVIQNITSNTWVANHTFGGAVFFIGGGVSPNLSGALNLVSVTRSGTNTFDTGTINLLWE
jgi:hypothetical protein